MKNVCGMLVAVVLLGAFNGEAFSQWQRVGFESSKVHAIARINNILWVGTDNSGVFRSTDNGTTWLSSGNGITNNFIKTITGLVVDTTVSLYAGSNGGGAFVSFNGGETWVAANSGLTSPGVHSLAIVGSNAFAGTNGGGAFRFDLTGSWTAINSGLGNNFVHALAVDGLNLLAGTGNAVSEGGVYRSTDAGASWSLMNTATPIGGIRSMAVSDANIFVATNGTGVYVSTDHGASWTQRNSGLTTTIVRAISVNGSNLLAGTNGGGAYYSPDGGTSWQQINTGLNELSVLSVFVTSTHMFAGTSTGLYRRPLSEVTVVKENETATRQFALGQNYPNPFNPITKVTFAIGNSSFASLKVFDILGREVATLVHEGLNAGNYQIDFDGTGLSSGAYFYRLTAGRFSETKKFMLSR